MEFLLHFNLQVRRIGHCKTKLAVINGGNHFPTLSCSEFRNENHFDFICSS